MSKRKRGNSEGSIYQMQDGRWRAAVTIGKDNAGKPKRKVFTAPTRHEVRDLLTDALKSLQLGIPIVSEKQTVEKFLAHWLDQVVKPTVRPKTHRTYSDLVKNHISPALGGIALGKLSSQKVREFLNAKLSAGLSPRTVRHLLVTLRGALAIAVKDCQLPRNVAGLVDPPRVPKPETQAFTPEASTSLPGSRARLSNGGRLHRGRCCRDASRRNPRPSVVRRRPGNWPAHHTRGTAAYRQKACQSRT